MSSKAKVYDLAQKLGAQIVDDGDTIYLEAPKFHIVDPDQHSYTFDCWDSRAGVWRSVWQDLRRFERNGFDACEKHTTLTCDWCDNFRG